MTRATRSSAQSQELDKQTELAANTLRGKVATKKRKRTSIAETDEQPASKQLRSGDVSIKEEVGSHELEEVPEADKLADLPNAGDVPIHTGDAEKILDILEMCVLTDFTDKRLWVHLIMVMAYRIDTQGLLDRVFPLPLSSAEPSSSQSASYSFRTLLKESSQHPLCVLRVSEPHIEHSTPFSHQKSSLLSSNSSRSHFIHGPALQYLPHNSSVFAILPSHFLTRLLFTQSPYPSTSNPFSRWHHNHKI